MQHFKKSSTPPSTGSGSASGSKGSQPGKLDSATKPSGSTKGAEPQCDKSDETLKELFVKDSAPESTPATTEHNSAPPAPLRDTERRGMLALIEEASAR